MQSKHGTGTRWARTFGTVDLDDFCSLLPSSGFASCGTSLNQWEVACMQLICGEPQRWTAKRTAIGFADQRRAAHWAETDRRVAK